MTLLGSAGGGGGGGGAGGHILLSAVGNVTVTGTLLASGGAGGLAGQAIAPSDPGVYWHGRAGGAGGGGRVFVSGALVTGISRSAGSDGAGRSTLGVQSVGINVYVSQVSFNYDTSIPTSTSLEPDGLTMKIDYSSGNVTAPEWVFSTKEQLPTAAAYDSETSGPSAYIAGKPLKIRVKFKGAQDLLSASISGTIRKKDGTSLGYADFGAQSVSFAGGESGEITFTSSGAHSLVEANDVVIEWNAENGTDLLFQSVGGFPISLTEHRIYTVRKLPVAPMAVPWAKVLELSSILASGFDVTTRDETLIGQFSVGLFNSAWMDVPTRFFTAAYHYIYDPGTTCTCISGGGFYAQNFDLTEVFQRLQDGVPGSDGAALQCADNANFHSVLAASQGAVARPLFMRDTVLPKLITAPYNRAGTSIFKCHLDCFTFHQVPTWQPPIGTAKLFDTSARACSATLSSCNTNTDAGLAGDNFFDLTLGSYLPTVFPINSAANIESGPVTISIVAPGTCAI